MTSQLQTKGYVKISNFLDRSLADYLWNYLKFTAMVKIDSDQGHSSFVVGSLGNSANDLAFESLLKLKQMQVESIAEIDLTCTYSFARIYVTGNRLKPHTDRPACEISVSVQLGYHGSRPSNIIMKNEEIPLENGDAVIYKGCEVEHSRQLITEHGFYQGQVFLHYVDSQGIYAVDHEYDGFAAKSKYFIHDINTINDK